MSKEHSLCRPSIFGYFQRVTHISTECDDPRSVNARIRWPHFDNKFHLKKQALRVLMRRCFYIFSSHPPTHPLRVLTFLVVWRSEGIHTTDVIA